MASSAALVFLARLARGPVPAVAIAAALLAVAPPLGAPFSTPKRVVLVGAAGVALVLWPWSRRRVPWPLVLPVISAGLSALLGASAEPSAAWTQLAFAVLAFCWASGGVAPAWVPRSATACGALVAAIAISQAVGVDPFSALSPDAAGTRLAVYATLGNPDFVASALCVVLCLALGAGWRWPVSLGVALVLGAALYVTRSFATVAALGVGATVAALHRRASLDQRARLVLVAAVLGIAALAVPLTGRSLSDAAQGRRYLVAVALPHALDAPLLGLGPGATEALWPGWELDWWKRRCGDDATCVAGDAAFRFAGMQDHLHADWLEVLVERGLAGLLSLALLFAVAARQAWGSRTALATATVAALAVSATRALADFPLARPADLCLLAAVVGLAFSVEDA